MATSPFDPRRKRFDRADFYWLAYLIFLLIEPMERRSLHYWIETLVVIAIFLALYVAFLLRGPNRRQYLLLGGMTLLGAVDMPHNGGAAAFIIYTAALVSFVVTSPMAVMAVVLSLAALLVGEGLWLHFNPWAIFINAFFTLVVGGTNFHFAQKHRSDCKLRMQQEEIEALAAVAERERIARDLHDVLGHTLSVIVLKSELASRLLQRELTSGEPADLTTLQRAQTEIADVEKTARTALAEVRQAIGGYRARGLAAEVETARNILASAGVTLVTEGDLHPAGLSAAEETVLALALREAVTNIVRHARATTCHLRLVLANGRHHLSIEDNGAHPIAREGNGLRGMRERVEALGGQLSLSREAGTLLQIELPQRAV